MGSSCRKKKKLDKSTLTECPIPEPPESPKAMPYLVNDYYCREKVDKAVQFPEERIIYARSNIRCDQYPSARSVQYEERRCQSKQTKSVQCPSSTDICGEAVIRYPSQICFRFEKTDQHPRLHDHATDKSSQCPSDVNLRVEKSVNFPRRGSHRPEREMREPNIISSHPRRYGTRKDKGVQFSEREIRRICAKRERNRRRETPRDAYRYRSKRSYDEDETETSNSDLTPTEGESCSDICEHTDDEDDDSAGKYVQPQSSQLICRELICQEAHEIAHQIMQTNFSLPLIVIELKPNLPHCILEWLITRIQSSQENGGAEMKVVIGYQKTCQGIFLGIDADVWRLADAAKRAGMVKWSKCDQLMSVMPETLPLFYLVLKCEQEGLVKQMIPLHDCLELNRLFDTVRWPFHTWKIDLLACYFGPSIAIFFGLVLRYLYVVVVCAVIAILGLLLSYGSSHNENENGKLSVDLHPLNFTSDEVGDWKMVIHAIINLCASIIFLLMTKRYLGEMTVRWAAFTTGPGDNRPRKEPSVDGQFSSHQWKNFFKEFFISLPLTLLLAIITVIFANFLLELNARSRSNKDANESLEDLGPNARTTAEVPVFIIVCALFLWLSVWLFVRLARILTEWEGHLLETQFHSSLVGKIILFVVIACFSPLLFVIIIQRDAENTTNYILLVASIFAIMDIGYDIFIIAKVGNNLMPAEQVTTDPTQQYPASFFLSKNIREIPRIPRTDPIVEEAENQMKLTPCKDTINDFLSLFVNMGFLFLYSSIASLVCIMSLVYVIVILPLKIHRLCKGQQRPLAIPSLNALGWQNALEFLVVLAVCTNCLLLSFSIALRNRWGEKYSDLQWFAIFIWLQHIFLILVVAVIFLAPSSRQTADAAFAEDQRDSRPASRITLLHERSADNRKEEKRIRKKDSFKLYPKGKADINTVQECKDENDVVGGYSDICEDKVLEPRVVKQTTEKVSPCEKENQENDKRNKKLEDEKMEKKTRCDNEKPGLKSKINRAFCLRRKRRDN